VGKSGEMKSLLVLNKLGLRWEKDFPQKIIDLTTNRFSCGCGLNGSKVSTKDCEIKTEALPLLSNHCHSNYNRESMKTKF